MGQVLHGSATTTEAVRRAPADQGFVFSDGMVAGLTLLRTTLRAQPRYRAMIAQGGPRRRRTRGSPLTNKEKPDRRGHVSSKSCHDAYLLQVVCVKFCKMGRPRCWSCGLA